jgi:hypothetical protein
MRIVVASVAVVGLWAAAAAAEVIEFRSDEDIMIVRGRQVSDAAVFELLGSQDGQILCVAMDEGGQPLATSTSYLDMGSVIFRELEAQSVARVACRYN